jgi:hypothetical protein
VLDRFGLPKTTIGSSAALSTASDPTSTVPLTSISSVRAGDSFQIKVGSSSMPTTVTIAANDTLQTLKDKIQRAGLYQINVTTQFNGTGTALSLKPASDYNTFQLISGPAGQDALEALGLKPGLIRNTTVDKTKGVVPADKGTQTYGLRFTSALDLNSKADIKTALDGIGNAITTVRAIYADLKQAATPKSQTHAATSGTVPAYLQNQIADYQAALDRLTGGSDSGSSLASLFG